MSNIKNGIRPMIRPQFKIFKKQSDLPSPIANNKCLLENGGYYEFGGKNLNCGTAYSS